MGNVSLGTLLSTFLCGARRETESTDSTPRDRVPMNLTTALKSHPTRNVFTTVYFMGNKSHDL